MAFTVHITRTAQKSLAKIDTKVRTAIVQTIRDLGDQPYPNGSKKLTGRAAWRVRVGDYRVIYETYKDDLIVLVVAIGHRSDIYKTG